MSKRQQSAPKRLVELPPKDFSWLEIDDRRGSMFYIHSDTLTMGFILWVSSIVLSVILGFMFGAIL